MHVYISRRVQVHNKHILAQNLYYNQCYPNCKNQMIGNLMVLEPLGFQKKTQTVELALRSLEPWHWALGSGLRA